MLTLQQRTRENATYLVKRAFEVQLAHFQLRTRLGQRTQQPPARARVHIRRQDQHELLQLLTTAQRNPSYNVLATRSVTRLNGLQGAKATASQGLTSSAARAGTAVKGTSPAPGGTPTKLGSASWTMCGCAGRNQRTQRGGSYERGEVRHDGETGDARVRFFGRGERERAVERELGCGAEPPRDEGEDGELCARQIREEEGEDQWVMARLEADVARAVWLVCRCICC